MIVDGYPVQSYSTTLISISCYGCKAGNDFYPEVSQKEEWNPGPMEGESHWKNFRLERVNNRSESHTDELYELLLSLSNLRAQSTDQCLLSTLWGRFKKPPMEWSSLAREGKIFSWVEEEKSCPRHHGLSAARSTASHQNFARILSSPLSLSYGKWK